MQECPSLFGLRNTQRKVTIISSLFQNKIFSTFCRLLVINTKNEL